jgi:serine/threonine transporter
VDAADTAAAPTDLVTVLTNLLTNLVANPIHALAALSVSVEPETLVASTSVSPNFLGILVWACLLGVCLIKARQSTKDMVEDLAYAISQIVRWVIKFAPVGVMGLIYTAISTTGLSVLVSYGQIILLLVGIMLLDALVLNPIIVFTQLRQNPYPLVLRCLKDSGITAFFTRSSAANIPVNMQLCEDLGLDKDTYAISIPLGATINMAGAAITISTLTMCCCYTIGHQVPLGLAIILSVLSALSACGASGVPGGSLLLIPLACSLFGIPGDIAAQVIGVGFIVAVIQDSMETAINSSTDALFTATADFKRQKKEGKKIKVSIFG